MNLRWSVVSFDVGGTLIEPWPSVGHVYAASAAALGLGEIDTSALNRQFSAAWKHLAGLNFDYSPAAWAAVVSRSFAGLVPEPGSAALFAEAYKRFALPSSWRVYPDVRSTLRALREAGVRLVVSSNWDDRLGPLLRQLGLASEFEWIGASVEIGYHKPDRRFFHAIMSRLGVAPEQILHVGDRQEEDLAGARSAGWSATRIRRPIGGASPTDGLASLDEVIPLVLDGWV